MVSVTIYGVPLSAPTRIVMMTCEVLGVKYELVETNPLKGDTQTKEFLKVFIQSCCYYTFTLSFFFSLVLEVNLWTPSNSRYEKGSGINTNCKLPYIGKCNTNCYLNYGTNCIGGWERTWSPVLLGFQRPPTWGPPTDLKLFAIKQVRDVQSIWSPAVRPDASIMFSIFGLL